MTGKMKITQSEKRTAGMHNKIERRTKFKFSGRKLLNILLFW
jgi:hypothetical protein